MWLEVFFWSKVIYKFYITRCVSFAILSSVSVRSVKKLLIQSDQRTKELLMLNQPQIPSQLQRLGCSVLMRRHQDVIHMFWRYYAMITMYRRVTAVMSTHTDTPSPHFLAYPCFVSYTNYYIAYKEHFQHMKYKMQCCSFY